MTNAAQREPVEPPRNPDAAPVLQVCDIYKSYGENAVLNGVGLAIARGEIYGLMGANGAGKSTLIKVLCGAEAPDSGSISVDGRNVVFPDPLAAVRAGVGTVHQNPNDGVVLDMTVAENLGLDRLNSRSAPLLFSRRRAESDARDVAEVLGLQLSRTVLRTPVRELGVSERQLLVLARALSREPALLILDEPTSALSSEETARLFGLLLDRVAGGTTLLYVSHKLAEFDALCNRVGVLRDGVLQGEFSRHSGADTQSRDALEKDSAPMGFDWPTVLTALFDRTPAEMARTESAGSDVVLSLRDVAVFEDSEPISVDVNRGEVTVLLGLLGSGKSELLESLFGARPLPTGTVTLNEKPSAPKHPAEAMATGIYLVPESRHEQGIIPGWSIDKQLTLPFTSRFSSATLMKPAAERAAGRSTIERLGIVAQSGASPIGTLSGGNQQKVMVGRWLLGEPTVLLLDEPFRGVDINARHDIGDTIRDLTATAAVLVATSDLDEALEVADRILVIRQGAIVRDVRLSDAHRSALIAAMSHTQSSALIAAATDEATDLDIASVDTDPLDTAAPRDTTPLDSTDRAAVPDGTAHHTEKP